MASYSKSMVEVAGKWLASNPDPGSLDLIVPGLRKNRDDREARKDRVRSAFTALSGSDRTTFLKEIQEIEGLERDRAQTATQLLAVEKAFEDLLNQSISPAHRKLKRDDEFYSDIGTWCLSWARHGYNTMDLSADFCAAMLLTDARELDIADVRSPFPGLLMLLPDGFAVGSEGRSYTKIHITELPRRSLVRLVLTPQLESIIGQLPYESRRRVIDRVDPPIGPGSLLGSDTGLNTTGIQIYATDGIHVLETMIDRTGLTRDAFDALPDTVTEDADRQARQAIRQIVFGTLAYIHAVPSAMEQRTVEQRNPKRERERGPAPTSWEVGRTIKIDPNLVRAVRSGSREIAFRLKHKHIVRGHYRNQPVGPGRQERKRIWITPFWRGPEGGAALVHTYKPE